MSAHTIPNAGLVKHAISNSLRPGLEANKDCITSTSSNPLFAPFSAPVLAPSPYDWPNDKSIQILKETKFFSSCKTASVGGKAEVEWCKHERVRWRRRRGFGRVLTNFKGPPNEFRFGRAFGGRIKAEGKFALPPACCKLILRRVGWAAKKAMNAAWSFLACSSLWVEEMRTISPMVILRNRSQRPAVMCRMSNTRGEGAGPPIVSSSRRGHRSSNIAQNFFGSFSILGSPSVQWINQEVATPVIK